MTKTTKRNPGTFSDTLNLLLELSKGQDYWRENAKFFYVCPAQDAHFVRVGGIKAKAGGYIELHSGIDIASNSAENDETITDYSIITVDEEAFGPNQWDVVNWVTIRQTGKTQLTGWLYRRSIKPKYLHMVSTSHTDRCFTDMNAFCRQTGVGPKG